MLYPFRQKLGFLALAGTGKTRVYIIPSLPAFAVSLMRLADFSANTVSRQVVNQKKRKEEKEESFQ